MRLMRQWIWLSIVLMTALLMHADSWSAPAAELAMKVVGKVGPGSAIAFNVSNRSSLTSSDVRSITSQIESRLRAARIWVVAPSQAIATVNVTLSENAQGYLWIAEIQRSSGADVVMQPVERRVSDDLRDASALTLRRRLLLVQDDPILDVELRPDIAVVLTPSRVVSYRIQGTNWHELGSQPLTYRRAMPRDIRGRLWNNSATVLGVSLPGVRCMQVVADSAALSCSETDDPWPVYAGASIGMEAFFSPVRNFFTGTIAFYDPQKQPAFPASETITPFYSAASVSENGLPLWVFAGVDGRVSFFGGKSGPTVRTANIQGWGSDIASIATSCRSPFNAAEGMNGTPERFVIATRAGDRSRADAVQAFRITNVEAVAAASAVEFTGPITALWSLSLDNAQAIAVSHNTTTGKYEAYSLSLVCNQ